MTLFEQPPVARREPKTNTIHATDLVDDYGWMRDKNSSELLAHLEAENSYTLARMADTTEVQATLYREMLSHIKETDESVPYRKGAWFYSSRTVEGMQYPVHCRRAAAGGAAADESAAEVVLLDVNLLAEGQPFMALGALAVSPDGWTLAYSTDITGFRQYTLHLRDLRTGEDLDDTAERVGSVAWAADSKTLFYTTEDEVTKRHDRLWRHEVGRKTAEDAQVIHEPDERFNLGIGKTRDDKYLLLEAASHTTSECRFLAAEEPGSDFRLIAERVDDQEYTVDHRNGLFYIRANDVGRNFRVVTAAVGSAGREDWVELLPLDPEVPVEDFEVFASFCVISKREFGLPTLEVRAFLDDGGLSEARLIAFPEPTYSAGSQVNAEFEATRFRYSYQSLVSPAAVFEYDVKGGTSVLLKRQEVPGGFNPDNYASERVMVPAADGVRVPVSLVYRRESFAGDGRNPLYLYGYGSYGFALPVSFSPVRLALLDRGVVMAYAHIRGGGEMGDAWHDAGKMRAKENTFSDFIAAAEQLVAQGYGARDRVAIEGGSAGGLLLGAVLNRRPELFRVVLSHVPFVDVMNTMLDATLPLTVAEYEEWGNPNEPGDFETILRYSPYENLKRGAYPAMLVKTSLNDSQVMYWEPAKYVAKLRTLKTNDTPLLLHINMEAGHGGASGRYDYLKEIAFDYAFLMRELGVAG